MKTPGYNYIMVIILITTGARLLKRGVADGTGDLAADSLEREEVELRLPVRERGVW